MSKNPSSLSFIEYQSASRKTAIYPRKGKNFIYPTLGLSGETGEIAEKIKKILRDNKGVVDDDSRKELSKELGDVLWYMANLAVELGLNLEEIARENLSKLASRKRRGQLHGSGDNR